MHITLVSQFNVEYSIQLANALSRKERTTILLWQDIANEYTQFLQHPVEAEFIPKPRAKNLKNLNLALKTTRRIKEMDPDIVHIQNPYTWFCPGLPFLKGYPIVLTIHDPTPHIGREQAHFKWVTKYFLPFSDRVIVHGKRMKELMMKEYKVREHKVRIIPHGDFSFYGKLASEGIKEEDNSVLFFGRIWKYKGLEYLIKAEQTISNKIPNLKIVIAGKGKFGKYRKLIRNQERYAIYNEFIPNEKVPELFQKASVVVLPYIEASQSGIIPIAYSFKKPVIVTDVGSLPEVVDDGKTGFVVPPKDHQRLADAIITILSDNERRITMGKNAYEKMQEELSWDRIADKTIEVYKEII